jgi:hypothetical protein
MMRRFRARLALPFVLASVLAISMSGLAAASAPWSSGCSGVANSNYVCVFSDRDLSGWVGHMSGSNINYAGQTYPGGTFPVNDTISSTENLYGSYDAVWYHEASYGGDNVCVPSNYALTWVGLFHNDAFSSHLIAVGSTC